MTKHKSKNGAVSKDTINPFELHQRRKQSIQIKAKNKLGSKFINKRLDPLLQLQQSSRRTQKLSLYNLNEPISITHNNQPIEDNYNDAISERSEDDLEFDGDYTRFSEILQNHKERRLILKKDKENQKNLLDKIDSQFEEIDFSEFLKAPKRSYENAAIPKSDVKFEANIRALQTAPKETDRVNDLFFKFTSEKNLDRKCEIMIKIQNYNFVINDSANSCLNEIVNSLDAILKSNNTSDFCRYFDMFVSFLLFMCNKSQKEYRAYFTQFMYDMAENTFKLEEPNHLKLLLLLKVVKMESALYKGGLILLEHWLSLGVGDLSIGKILILTAYNAILENGSFIPQFYPFCMEFCLCVITTCPDIIITILDLVKTTLKILIQYQCNVYPICIHFLDRYLDKLPSSTIASEFKTFVQNILKQPLEFRLLDIYQRSKIEPQIPLYSIEPTRERKPKMDKNKYAKEEYKALKRELNKQSFAQSAQQKLQLSKKREESQKNYKRVLRDAMIEQVMLKKEKKQMKFGRILFFSNISKFNQSAFLQLQKLYEKIDVMEQLESVEFDGSVLKIEHGNKFIVINKHEPSRQIWYSSFSGVDYFKESNGEWVSERNARTITTLVSQDVCKLIGKNVNI
ncbi:bifunctional Frataxin-CyaY superfamily/Frataxin-CyaY/Frataxin conserved site [Babesia duncani]|uniref:Bifunctional Frataxin-CyaY superfamily/Frataxin-CyaY/Frataxin conserved site n=1 Tax=Babesia duncani TaxID=323732 RepID=A0AAD9PHY4_9APIC|nr:bifunctional Frataxin-CyaY superfamily/Frataxin-CyaY/Frataxin conserved site [Babesia duncani]